MRLLRFALALLAVALAAFAASVSASAKEEVRAKLTTTIPMSAPPGERIEVAWKLFYVDDDGKRRPFGASGVFVRLVSASGDATSEGFAPDHAGRIGRYRASVVVPAGGIGDVEIGLMGWQSDAAGTRRGDMLFPITNEPRPAAAPAVASPVAEAPAPAERPGPGSSRWRVAPLAAALAVLAALAVAVVVRRRRSLVQRGV